MRGDGLCAACVLQILEVLESILRLKKKGLQVHLKTAFNPVNPFQTRLQNQLSWTPDDIIYHVWGEENNILYKLIL